MAQADFELASRAVFVAEQRLKGSCPELVRERDLRYAATFERGTHQGITRDHFLELELGPDAEAHAALRLLAHGWIYPTDSSINVALGQSSLPACGRRPNAA